MPDISHVVDIQAAPDVVFELVSTASGIRRWWSASVDEGDSPGSEITVRFGEKWQLALQKVEEVKDRSVTFCITRHDSDEWLDTELHFVLEPDDEWTILKFDQRKWADKTDFYRFCTTKWVSFLLSIKLAAETGTGTPYPDETKIGQHD